MTKLDLKKEFKRFYNPSPGAPTIVDVPAMTFLMIDGKGDPNTAPEYREAIEALYPVAYALKFTVRRELDIDYGVMPLEGLWWADDMSQFPGETKDAWKWTAMIMQPDCVTNDLFRTAVEQVKKKKNPAQLYRMRFEPLNEGMSAQVLHTGPYSGEGPTIQALHAFIKGQGYALRGKHHEIYLGDPRKSTPEKLKTVVRQPVSKTG